MHWVWKNVIWCNFILPAPICMASKKNKLKSYKTHVVILKYCLINYYFANNPTCTRKPCIFFYNLRVILKKMVGYQRWLSKEPVCYGRGLKWCLIAVTHAHTRTTRTVHWSMASSKSCLHHWTPCLQYKHCCNEWMTQYHHVTYKLQIKVRETTWGWLCVFYSYEFLLFTCQILDIGAGTL